MISRLRLLGGPVSFRSPIYPNRTVVKIAVCIKRVPEMDVKFRIAPSGTAVDETGLKFDMSDFDGYAVEFALQTTLCRRRCARRSVWGSRARCT